MTTRPLGSRYLTIGVVFAIVGLLGGMLALGALVGHYTMSHSGRRSREVMPVEVVHRYSGGDDAGDPAADDGELHDARRTDVPYELQEGMWSLSGTKSLRSYDMDVECAFVVRYPVLEGDLPHVDKINALLRSVAMESVRTYYEDPSDETVAIVRKMAKDSGKYAPEDADALLSSTVDYAVSYNDEKLLSVCYSDEYYVGSVLLGFISLRTVNVNLETGESYELDDVLDVSEEMATSFVDNLVKTTGVDANGDGKIVDDECETIAIAGRDALEEALQGKGDLGSDRMRTSLFIDGNGQPNLGATYWLSGDGGTIRGWWDVTITDKQLKAAKKDSGLWELLGKG